jgi:hypothetical protein
MVRTMNFYNADTAAVVLTVRVRKGANTYRIFSGSVPAGTDLAILEIYVLDATDESIEALLSAPPATAQPEFQSAWADHS